MPPDTGHPWRGEVHWPPQDEGGIPLRHRPDVVRRASLPTGRLSESVIQHADFRPGWCRLHPVSPPPSLREPRPHSAGLPRRGRTGSRRSLDPPGSYWMDGTRRARATPRRLSRPTTVSGPPTRRHRKPGSGPPQWPRTGCGVRSATADPLCFHKFVPESGIAVRMFSRETAPARVDLRTPDLRMTGSGSARGEASRTATVEVLGASGHPGQPSR